MAKKPFNKTDNPSVKRAIKKKERDLALKKQFVLGAGRDLCDMFGCALVAQMAKKIVQTFTAITSDRFRPPFK